MANNIVFFVFVAFVAQGAFTESAEEEDLLSEFFTKLNNSKYPMENPQAVSECFTMHSQSFTNLANYLQTMTSVAGKEIEKGIGPDQFSGRMQTISNSFKKLPELVWPEVLIRNFNKALEEANKVAVTVNEGIDGLVKELRKKNRTVFNKATKELDSINAESRRKSKFITKRVKECIKKGGPYGENTSK